MTITAPVLTSRDFVVEMDNSGNPLLKLYMDTRFGGVEFVIPPADALLLARQLSFAASASHHPTAHTVDLSPATIKALADALKPRDSGDPC